MENLVEMVSVPVIVSIVYVAMQLYKYVVNGSEKWIRLIPVWGAILGVVLGVIAFYAVPGIVPADNVFTAILIGGASGLAATGTNQIFKQLTKGKEGEESNDTTDKSE